MPNLPSNSLQGTLTVLFTSPYSAPINRLNLVAGTPGPLNPTLLFPVKRLIRLGFTLHLPTSRSVPLTRGPLIGMLFRLLSLALPNGTVLPGVLDITYVAKHDRISVVSSLDLAHSCSRSSGLTTGVIRGMLWHRLGCLDLTTRSIRGSLAPPLMILICRYMALLSPSYLRGQAPWTRHVIMVLSSLILILLRTPPLPLGPPFMAHFKTLTVSLHWPGADIWLVLIRRSCRVQGRSPLMLWTPIMVNILLSTS